MKKVWITALSKEQEPLKKIMVTLKNYGLMVDGHFWEDNLAKMAWNGPLPVLADRDTALWIIMGSEEAFNAPSVRLGLSLLAVSVQAKKDSLFPLMLITTAGNVTAEALPSPLAGADIMPYSNPSLGARAVAKANMPAKKGNRDYRLDTYAIPQIGLWFEAGPAIDPWEGVIFGVSGAEILAHGAGKAGELPEKAVLEYPMKGIKVAVSGREYTAWAVKNRLDSGQSYYVKVKGDPDALIFGAFPEGAEADLYSLKLL
jgi:hypothetical protein